VIPGSRWRPRCAGQRPYRPGPRGHSQHAEGGRRRQERLQTVSLTTRDIENHEDYQASGFSLGGGYSSGGTGKPSDGSPPGGVSGQGAVPNQAGGINGASAGIGSASGHQSSTTTSGISGIAGDTAVRTGDGSNGLVKTFDADKVQKDIAAQVQITSTFGQQAASAWGTYANSRMTEAQTPEERACWSADGACRVAGHAVIAGLGGGIGAAFGTAASTGLAAAVDAAVSGAGLTGGAHDSVVAGLSAVIGATVGGGAGAAGAFNEVTNNYLTSRQWQSFADELGACQASSGGCGATEDAAIRARYQNLSTQQNIALANCEKTGNCAPLRADVTSGTDAMLRLAAIGAIPIGGAVGNDMGQYLGQRLANDPAYRATVNNAIAVLNACNTNPAACTQQAIRAAALVVGPLIGAGVIGSAATIGATAESSWAAYRAATAAYNLAAGAGTSAVISGSFYVGGVVVGAIMDGNNTFAESFAGNFDPYALMSSAVIGSFGGVFNTQMFNWARIPNSIGAQVVGYPIPALVIRGSSIGVTLPAKRVALDVIGDK